MTHTHSTPIAWPRFAQILNPSSWGRTWRMFLTISISIGLSIAALADTSSATPGEPSPHQVKTLEIPLPDGNINMPLTFAVYEQHGIQYFSGGLGKEERSVIYPPVPLKLIFVQGERAFLAGISVDIAKEDGTQLLSIPGKEVEGPWLFINLPTGTYVISGTRSQGLTIKKTITLQPGKSTTVHLRWP